MNDPGEYLKLKYMGDCKCGNCQLVPPEDLLRWDNELRELRALVVSIHRVTGSHPSTVREAE